MLAQILGSFWGVWRALSIAKNVCHLCRWCIFSSKHSAVVVLSGTLLIYLRPRFRPLLGVPKPTRNGRSPADDHICTYQLSPYILPHSDIGT